MGTLLLGHLIDATHVLVSEVVQVPTYLHPPSAGVPLEETPFGPSACCKALQASISASESPSSTILRARLFSIRPPVSGDTYMSIVDLPDCEMMPWFC